MSDKSIREKSKNFCGELEALFEQRIIVQKMIEDFSNNYKDIEPSKSEELEMFDETYILHNVNIFWNIPVRNAIFKLIELQSKAFAIKYCLSNTAVRAISELVKKIEHNDGMKESLINIDSDSTQRANAILHKLVQDLKKGANLVVEDETVSEANSTNITTPLSSQANAFTDVFSPNFVSNDQSAELYLLVKLIYPQVNLEVDYEGAKHAVLLGSHSMDFKATSILDSSLYLKGLADDADKANALIKTRNILMIKEAQFFVTKNDAKCEWPVWAPLENLVDFSIPLFGLVRIIDQVELIYYRDKPNPLYFRNNQKSKKQETDLFSLNFPNLQFQATALQFNVFFDCINNLLIYKDPDSGQRTELLKKMLLILSQMEDISHQKDYYVLLQDKCRKLESALNLGFQNHEKSLVLRKQWVSARNNLYVFMEALKCLRDRDLKRNSVTVSWELVVTIDQFEWLMLQDDNIPFCSWIFAKSRFILIQNEDQSSEHTLEIDSLSLINLNNGAEFPRILSATDEKREVSYEKHKMLRILWRDNPPVGGIPVVNHFEVNIVPLSIQVTYEFGKQIQSYFFGNKPKGVTEQKLGKISPHIQKKSDFVCMQERASKNRSIIYFKVPEIDIYLSYRGPKGKNFADFTMIYVHLPTLEYRNKTLAWYDLYMAIKRDFTKAILAHAGTLVREKLFVKRNTDDVPKILGLEDDDDLPDSNSGGRRSSIVSNYLKKSMSHKKIRSSSSTDNFLDSNPNLTIEIEPSKVHDADFEQKARMLFGRLYLPKESG